MMHQGYIVKKVQNYGGGADFELLKNVLAAVERPWSTDRGFYPPVGTRPPRLLKEPVAASGAGTLPAGATSCNKRARKAVRIDQQAVQAAVLTDVIVLSSSGAFLGLVEGWTGEWPDSAQGTSMPGDVKSQCLHPATLTSLQHTGNRVRYDGSRAIAVLPIDSVHPGIQEAIEPARQRLAAWEASSLDVVEV